MDLAARARALIDIVRQQNWKNGGALTFDLSAAYNLAEQALRGAHNAAVEAAIIQAGETRADGGSAYANGVNLAVEQIVSDLERLRLTSPNERKKEGGR